MGCLHSEGKGRIASTALLVCMATQASFTQAQQTVSTPVPTDVQHQSSLRNASSHHRPTPGWAEALDHRGRQRIQYAFDLASRGAIHTAHQELLKVLRTVAQALDAEQQTREHSQSLTLAEVALEEAEDFVQISQSGARSRNMTSIVSAHRTPILKRTDPRLITPVIALQQYYSFAGKQFVTAAGRQKVAAEALYGLGRVTSLHNHQRVDTNDDAGSMSEQKMLVFYKSAWSVDPKHYQAANELGVLFAKFGQWEPASVAFEYSVAQVPEAQSWRNLAIAYDHLGKQQLAKQAWEHYRAFSQTKTVQVSNTSSTERIAPAVEWVDLETFSQSGTPSGADPVSSSELSEGQTQKARTASAMRSDEVAPGGLLSKKPFLRLKSVFNRSRSTP